MGNYRVFKRRADGSGIDTHFECLSINQMDSIARGMYFKEEENKRLLINPTPINVLKFDPIKPEPINLGLPKLGIQSNTEPPKIYDPLEGLLSKKKPWESNL
ncbi:MAG: hypothetical protein ACP5NZ_02005 [Nanobdellota archaeon]